VLLVGGWAALKWAWPMVAFLAFMIPLPFALETALSHPLRGVATRGSTWVLQTLGLPAVSEGHTILLEHGRIAVVEACSGLSMLLTFAAMTTAVAMVSTRPLLDRLIVVLSTVPVALAVNIARIVGNGIAIEVWNPEVANKWFHDQGGWLMMPLALGLLAVELWVLGRLLVEAPVKTDVPIMGLPPTPRKAAAAAS
jgi:exosortase